MKNEDRLLFDVAATGSGPSTQRTPFDVLGFNALLGEDEDDDGGMGSHSGGDGLGRPCALVRPRTRTEEPVPSHILQEWETKRPKDVYCEDLVAKIPGKRANESSELVGVALTSSHSLRSRDLQSAAAQEAERHWRNRQREAHTAHRQSARSTVAIHLASTAGISTNTTAGKPSPRRSNSHLAA